VRPRELPDGSHLARLGRITALIDTEPEAAALAQLRAAESTGRPLGAEAFVALLAQVLRRPLRRQKPGRKGALKREAGALFDAA
jgi:hypothetical protein